MAIIVCGINHKTASVALREKLYFAPEKVGLYLQDLMNSGLAREALLLSTCNRSELYCEADDAAALSAWFGQRAGDLEEEARGALYLHQGRKAVAHIMRVACGLDSMVLGEPEILGQVKNAYSESCTATAAGNVFHRLFQQVFAIAKEIRSTTMIGACPVSIASTTLTLVKQLLPDFAKARLLLLGAGDMVELLLRYLKTWPVQETTIVNRNLAKAQELAEAHGARAGALSELTTYLPKVNLVITATGSPEPLVTKALLEKLLPGREEPLYIFDIAVPRDVEADVASLPAVKLYCIDDLKTVITHNQQSRQHAAEKAQEIIEQRADEFMQLLASMEQVSDTIRAYRQQIEAICDSELEKILQKVRDNPEAERLLRHFAYALTNKLLHAPSVKLREAGVEGRLDVLRLAKQLLALPELEAKAL